MSHLCIFAGIRRQDLLLNYCPYNLLVNSTKYILTYFRPILNDSSRHVNHSHTIQKIGILFVTCSKFKRI
jgi:hypothetical protein